MSPAYRYALDGTVFASFAHTCVGIALAVHRPKASCRRASVDRTLVRNIHYSFSYVDDDLVLLPFGAAVGTNDGAEFLLTSFVNFSSS